jgi:P-type Ca2+ transporter type 2C
VHGSARGPRRAGYRLRYPYPARASKHSPPTVEESDGRASAWHLLPGPAVLAAVRSAPQGLAAAEARLRLAQDGPNVLIEAGSRPAYRILLDQFKEFMILVLIAAAAVSGLIGDAGDALAILAVLIVNAAVGFVQEYRAERAMEALRALSAPTATVARDGGIAVIPASELVAGDVVRLEAGGIVPADLRLLDAVHLRVQEAALTGESVPADKHTAPLADEGLPLGDRRNMAFRGTLVAHGRGRGVAVATGMRTELGRIAALLDETVAVKTPLQRRLAEVGGRLAVAALCICAVVFLMGVLRGESPLLMFLTAVSMAVAAIPEALPAVVTISLALGARKMIGQKALVRKLPAVETLGSITCICADKTGTLTVNRMRVEELYGEGVARRAPGGGPAWNELFRAMSLCGDARLDSTGKVVGDPTEVALEEAARSAGATKEDLEGLYPRVAEVPFEAERKCMTTVHRHPGGGFVSFTKGAPEVVLEASAGASAATTGDPLAPWREAAERMASEGLRVLAFATRRWPELPSLEPQRVEAGLSLLGLAGLLDPPREEARSAVETCRAAGIVPVMITGDHPLTARAIAQRVGILTEGAEMLAGQELATLSDEELEERAQRTRVYARVTPEQKLRIVKALQARGEVVAMTGDGVNDAPALKRADIGVAMGLAGTEVAKEAGSMVLLDDNFATIVRAVGEGRRIYDNVRRFVRYAVATNSAEVLTIFLAPLLGLPLPLLPLQILWINLVTDSLPGLALAAEPAEKGVMRRPPRAPRESLFARGLGLHVVWVGALMAAVTLGTQAFYLQRAPGAWQTMVFTVLCLSQLGHALAIRSERESLVAQGLLSNKPLLGAVALTVALQAGILYVPVLNEVFDTVPLGPLDLALAFGLSSVVFLAVEVEKWRARRRAPR